MKFLTKLSSIAILSVLASGSAFATAPSQPVIGYLPYHVGGLQQTFLNACINQQKGYAVSVNVQAPAGMLNAFKDTVFDAHAIPVPGFTSDFYSSGIHQSGNFDSVNLAFCGDNDGKNMYGSFTGVAEDSWFIFGFYATKEAPGAGAQIDDTHIISLKPLSSDGLSCKVVSNGDPSPEIICHKAGSKS